MLNSALGCCFPRLLLGICELDAALRGLLIVISYYKVATAIDYPVAIGQELLLVGEVSLKRIRLLLGVKRAYLLPYSSSSVEAA